MVTGKQDAIDHGNCVASTPFDKDAHVHEGETGWWRFASEPPGTPLWPDSELLGILAA